MPHTRLVFFVLAVAIPACAQTYIQQGPKLVGSGTVETGVTDVPQEGFAVAVSGDGNTAVVGGWGDNSNAGAAWIFTRANGVWTQQGNKLVGTGAVGAAEQGQAVAISADGNTVLIGGPGDADHPGAAWVFVRSGGVWTQQGPKLVATGVTPSANFGNAVALSADGNTAILGAPNLSDRVGGAFVFTRSGGVWTQQALLVGAGTVGMSAQGYGVGLSADGNTAIVGGYGDNSQVGAAWIFTRSNGSWTQQGDKLIGTGANGTASQGRSVAISGDGNTVMVGGPGDEDGGAVWVFTRSGGTWTQQGNRLKGSHSVFGWSVSLSGDGNTAAVGAWGTASGAAFVFTRTNGVWTQLGAPLVGTDTSLGASQGYSVSLSSDASTLIEGGPSDGNALGAAWVFVSTPGPALSIAKTHSGSFTQGQQNAVYTVTVANAATALASNGTVTVTETLPSGLTLVSMSGAGWTCSSNTCTRGDVLAPGSSYPPITVTVNVGATAVSPQVNQVTVSGGGSVTVSATDSTSLAPGPCTFSTDTTSISVPSGSGTTGTPLTGIFTLTMRNCTAADTWTAVSDSPRLQVSPTSGAGNGAVAQTTMHYSMFTNSSTSPRVAHINVAGIQVTFTQAGSTETPGQRVVRALYQTILGREPDANGWAFWTGPGAPTNTAGAVLYNQMADGFYVSPEFKNSGWLVLNIYQAVSGSLPTFATWLGSVSQIRNQTLTPAQLTDSQAAGESNSAFISDVFRNGFGRDPSSAEFNAALASLNGGQSKIDFLNSVIFASSEFTSRTNRMLVQALYYTILVRDVDSGGASFWLGQLDPPNGQDGIYYLYNPQPPTPQYAFKLAVIGQAVPPNPNLLGFLGSPEFQGLIQ